jgi:FK506-binding protein 15
MNSENGKYSSQGKLGSALLGNHDSCIYKLILYTGKQQHITYASINENFKFIVSFEH